MDEVIDEFDYNRKEAASVLLAYRRLLQNENADSSYNYSLILVNRIFSRILFLEDPPKKRIFYYSLLTELTKLDPKLIAPCLGKTIRKIYSSAESIEGETLMQFIDWFAYHLSNFGFSYKWQEWYLFLFHFIFPNVFK